MIRRFLLASIILLVGARTTQADLIANWNFNSLSITTASSPGSGGVPTSILASSGTGTLSLSGWAGTVDDFAGSTINAVGTDLAEESLSLISAGTSAPFPGNGSFITFEANLTGFENAIITFASRGTSTGFNSGLWSYSIDGVNFTAAGLPSTATTSTTFTLATADFSAISALDNVPTAFFRYTLSGATSNSGNNRIDNFQINATAIAAVPEPSSMALVGMVGFAGLAMRRRRNASVVS